LAKALSYSNLISLAEARGYSKETLRLCVIKKSITFKLISFDIFLPLKSIKTPTYKLKK